MAGTKTRATGADAQLLVAFETGGYGVPPVSGWTRMGFKSSSVGLSRDLGSDDLLGMGRDAQDPFYNAGSVSGSLTVPVDLRAFGLWLRGLFGPPVTTGAGPYTHVYTAGGAVPSLALELGHTKLTAPQYLRYSGSKLGSLALDWTRQGAVNASIDVMGQGETVASAPATATPADYPFRRFSQFGGAIRVNGALLGNVTGGKMTFSNGLEAVETIRDDGKIDGVDEGAATATGSVDVRYSTDTTLTAAIDAETPVALSMGWTLAGPEGYRLTLDLPRVFLPKRGQEIGGPGGLSASYDWRAASDPVAGYMLRVTLVNDVADYA